MKKNILLIITLLIFQTGLTQNLIETVDEFTGKKTTSTKIEKLFNKGLVNSSVLKYSFEKGDDKTILFVARLKVNGGQKVFAIDKGFEIIFLLKNKSTIVLKSKEKVVSSQGGARDSFFGTAIYGSKVTYTFSNKSDIEKLKKSLIQKVRVNTDEGYLDVKIKSKQAKSLLKNLNSIDNN